MESWCARFCSRGCGKHGRERGACQVRFVSPLCGSYLIYHLRANAFALFVKSQRKWSSPPLTDENVASFKARMNAFGYDPKHVLPHGSYLVNLANPDE